LGTRDMKTESQLQDYLIRRAWSYHIYARKVQAIGHTGFPDVFLARRGRTVLVELKSPTGRGKLSEKQKKEHERLREQDIEVRVIDNEEDVDDVIRNMLDA